MPAPTVPAPTATVTQVMVTNLVVTNMMPTKTTTPAGPKSIRNLAVTGLTIERPKGNKGSRLVYVTGIVKNNSNQQRFGVRVEIDLLDQAGTKVGMATDYTPIIEPRASWRLRALVLDNRTVGARLAAIKEEP